MNELHEVRDVWFQLGVQLKVPLADLRSISADYHDKSSRCLLEMLSTWLSRSTPSPPTWQRVVDALCCTSIGKDAIGEHIQQVYCGYSSGNIHLFLCRYNIHFNTNKQILMEDQTKY